ncbi:MFS transporter [Brevibacillus sp. B_LB10_24]|uniref:MFS transporter n=1 Tax=Brevibacillus sp. B_LB10_24 TaxID=3380645 RepID=UPI0038BD470C
MEIWKRNLFVISFALFIVMSAMSMVMPFLPLFIQEELGVEDPHQVTAWAGIVFGANFLTAGLISPLWGNLADKYGRKIMILRSGYCMSVIIALTGLVGNVWHLLGLRLLNGTVGGIIPAGTALVASATPKEKVGWAQGVLQSCTVAGTIMGPLFGGLLADIIGYRLIFVITGVLVLLSTILVTVTVKENFTPPPAREQTSVREDARLIFSTRPLPALFLVTVMIQFALLSVNPVLPMYVKSLLGSPDRVAFYAGLVTAAMGVANVIASPQLGKLGDRFGSQKVLLFCLIASALIFIPQAMVTQVWQLVVLRFLLGMFIGGLLPSVNSLLRRATPTHMISRVYGFNNSFLAFGSMLGPTIGGLLAGYVSLKGVFLMTGLLLLINSGWVAYSLWRQPLPRDVSPM